MKAADGRVRSGPDAKVNHLTPLRAKVIGAGETAQRIVP
jgi:hypothetical protein